MPADENQDVDTPKEISKVAESVQELRDKLKKDNDLTLF